MNRESGFLRETRRRQDMAREILPDTAKDFLSLFPHLLQTGLLEQSMKQKPLAPVRIVGYSPTYYTWELLQKLYSEFSLQDPPSNAPIILSIFMVGFYGNLAQKPQSKLECLLILKSDNQPEEWLLAFQNKLNMLENYAFESFQLDIKFSLTNLSHIQSGGFEYLNRPTPAMDMSAIEREYFCRTGVHFLGMSPICELFPPDANKTEFPNFLEMVESLPYPWTARYVNMNVVSSFDKNAFYAGCLARIAGFATAPFEAITRYAQFLDVLFKEKYNARNLCCKLRRERISRDAKLDVLDPYGALILDILPMFRDVLPPSATDILILAFVLKTECVDPRSYGPNHGAKTTLINNVSELKNNLSKFKSHLSHSRQDFQYLIKTGRALSLFLHSGLASVMSQTRKHPELLSISEEELISIEAMSNSVFTLEKNKVQRVPLLNSMTNYFQLIIFYKEKPPGKQPYYIAKGVPTGLKVKKENLQEINQDPSIASLLLWFAVNGITSQRVEADYSLSPMREADIKGLFRKISGFIQNGFIPDRDLKYVSKPKVIKKALLMLNLNTKRDVNVIFETDVAYITSWGEVFCQYIKVFGDKLQKHPYDFLKQNLTHPLLPTALLESWTPLKSRCPIPVHTGADQG